MVSLCPSSRLHGRLVTVIVSLGQARPGKRDEGAGAWGRIRATNKTSSLNCGNPVTMLKARKGVFARAVASVATGARPGA
jgi:hypothetical protein